MNILYNIGTRVYFSGIRIAAAFGHRKAGQMEAGRKDWASVLEEKMRPLEGQKIIWFHAASLGEFEQGRPLIEALHDRYPEYRVVQTFFSPSGYEVRKNYKGADVICYLPYDTPSNCRRFLDSVHPDIAVFVKYEFWGNILEELRKRSVPTYLVSGIFRKRQAFFRWYGGIVRPVLNCFTHLFVQDEESKKLVNGLGLQNVTVCGDTRFDRVIAIQQQAKEFPWAQRFAESAGFVMVAGSSWPKDEDILLEHFNNHPEMKLIIAPHEIHEEHVQSIIGKLKRPYMRYTQMDESKVTEADCLIIDAIGFLSGIYRYGQVAYIGGGFGVGIHNTLEAAVYGIPVVFGPNHTAFREALGLLDAGGGFTIVNADEYNTVLNRFLTDQSFLSDSGKKAGNYVSENSGATEVIFSAVFKNK
ncbi:MAG: 3-deoxy-D-manno-octulosonic acid transferase [Bacteroidales bacterium]|nr:3-deoxy-D-manno-octulosonic acid transferase [Bacteroidales bacterium]